MDRSAAHFVDSDIQGTSGLDDWTSNTYKYPEADPTKISISTMEELAKIGNDANYPLSGDYELLNDLDADGVTFWPIGFDSSDPEQNPVSFTGTFEGGYHTISNLSYTIAKNFSDYDFFSPDKWDTFGLFSTIDGSVSNLTIEGMEIECTWAGGVDATTLSDTGCLAAIITGTITNVHVVGSTASINTIQGALSKFGGICATAGGGAVFVGCSSNFNFIVTADSASQTISEIGGFCGAAGTATFTDCHTTGSIVNSGTAKLKKIGGFCGSATPATAVTWTNAYSAVTISGTVHADNTVGGFIGYWNQFAGADKLTFLDCFWDGDLTAEGLSDIGGGIGDVAEIIKGTSGDSGANDMYKQATFDEDGSDWDFTEVWTIVENVSYPTLRWRANSPDKIKTGEQNRTTAMPEDYTHLNGQTVQILEDGIVSPTQVVENGSVTTTGTTNHIGLQYKSKIKPMKVF